MPYLGMLDVSGIQRFVFRAPELKSITDASRLIEGLCKPPDGLFVQEITGITNLFAAGGNVAIIAEDRKLLEQRFCEISRALLDTNTGLEVVAAIWPYNINSLAHDYQQAVWELQRRKWTQPRSASFRLTGVLEPPADLSSLAKEPETAIGKLKQPLRFDDVLCEGYISGQREKTGLMAVVSVDGMGMGARLQAWLKDMADQNKNDKDFKDKDFVEQFNAWSESLKIRWEHAWNNSLKEVERQFDVVSTGEAQDRPEYRMKHPVLHQDDAEARYIRLDYGKGDVLFTPCRKIYQGGDDLSFVCDARIALSLTTHLMQELEKEWTVTPVHDLFKKMTVSAGIVFVDSHFPFARAVRLAEAVGKNAKKQAKKVKDEEDLDYLPSTLDWWVNRQGDLTRPEPLYPGASLKPYVLEGPVLNARSDLTWRQMEDVVLPGMWALFGGSRGKFKDLLNEAEDDSTGNAVKHYLKLRPLEEKDVDGNIRRLQTPFEFMKRDFGAVYDGESGFSKDDPSGTPLLDAGELFDIHFPFKAPEGAQQ